MKGTAPCPKTGRKSDATFSEIAFDFLPVPIRIVLEELDHLQSPSYPILHVLEELVSSSMKGTESVKLFKKLERGEFLFGPPTTILGEF